MQILNTFDQPIHPAFKIFVPAVPLVAQGGGGGGKGEEESGVGWKKQLVSGLQSS